VIQRHAAWLNRSARIAHRHLRQIGAPCVRAGMDLLIARLASQFHPPPSRIDPSFVLVRQLLFRLLG
jgi:hypothetical protein